MTRTEEPWQNDGTDPYGHPEPKGNADEVWHLLTAVPCPDCGATSKHLVVEGRAATVRCGEARP